MVSPGNRLFAVAFLFLAAHLSAQSLTVVATTHDLGDIAREIGGKEIACEVLSFGDQDPHRVSARPSTLIKLRKADVLLVMGLDLEHAWLPPLLEGARNDAILPGAVGHVDVSSGITPLEIPASLDRSKGTDLHAKGNPHFNASPEGGRHIARKIAEGFIRRAPDKKSAFDAGLATFEKKLDAKLAEWKPKLERLRGVKFVCRHGFFPYFTAATGCKIIADLEATPGLEPSPAHVAKVVGIIRAEKPCALLVPSWKSGGLTESIAASTGIRVIALPMGSTGRAPDTSWLSWMEHLVTTLSEAAPSPKAL